MASLVPKRPHSVNPKTLNPSMAPASPGLHGRPSMCVIAEVPASASLCTLPPHLAADVPILMLLF
jgi:hypothetical protein